MVTLRIPVPPMMVANVLGVLSLLGFVAAIGALTDWRWALLTASLIGIGLAYVGMLSAQRAEVAATRTAQAGAGVTATMAERTLKSVG